MSTGFLSNGIYYIYNLEHISFIIFTKYHIRVVGKKFGYCSRAYLFHKALYCLIVSGYILKGDNSDMKLIASLLKGG